MMESKFKLSSFNKKFIGVAALIFLLLFVVFSDKAPYQIGVLIGRLMVLFLLPTLFAWIVWRFTGRKKKAASITFNIVLSLILLGQIGQFGNRQQQTQTVRELQEIKAEFKKEVTNSDDPAVVSAAFDKFSDSAIEGINELSETSSGDEKEFFKIMGEFASESQLMVQGWHTANNKVQSPRILDYSLLTSDGEFDYQRSILKEYIEKTVMYNEFFENLIPNIKARLSVLGEDNSYTKGAVDAATEKYFKQKPIFEPLMQTHIEYGNNLIQILDFLQKNEDEWAYENDELLLNSDELLSEYNKMAIVLESNIETINTLSNQLVNQM
jgi:hypothetical protein